MELSGVHLLLTYACTLECEHCFVWGSPWQTGTMTIADVEEILRQADELGTVRWIYFEGGEPFLHYAVLVHGVRKAAALGFRVGIVSNAYWATSVDDALAWLEPLRGLVADLSISRDEYHRGEASDARAEDANAAAVRLGIPTGTICVAAPEDTSAARAVGQLPAGQCAVVYRGRAADRLATRAKPRPWTEFTRCPCEDLREPGRVHVDPLGHVHVCQGLCVGNVFRIPLREICRKYAPDAHPIVGPLLRGGPAALARCHDVPPPERCADACHLCDQIRRRLRPRFPDLLAPDQMYGVATP